MDLIRGLDQQVEAPVAKHLRQNLKRLRALMRMTKSGTRSGQVSSPRLLVMLPRGSQER
jgi:hypothetical protein